MLSHVESLGGEGLMLRQSGSRYEAGRSSSLLKVKRFHGAEACVVGHEPGRCRHKGRLGALLVQMADGTRFAVGTGLSDSERGNPPPLGSVITFRYQELSDGGVPRFPSFVRVCQNSNSQPTELGESTMANVSSKRRFEFVGGGSDKFWELEIHGTQVTVRFGRNGTHGQSTVKRFADEARARRHAEQLIRQKLGKGYVEIN